MARPRLLPVTIGIMGIVLPVKIFDAARCMMAGVATAHAEPVAAPAPAPMPMLAPPSVEKPPAPAVSEAERALLLDLRHRRETLEARGRALDDRQGAMAAAEQKLAARVAELNALQARLEALEEDRRKHDAANWLGLVRTYETMKPREAAAIFDALDMQVLLAVLDRMSTRKAAPILAAMQTDRARLATQLLAEQRTRAVTPAGEAPPGRPAAP